MDDRKYNSFDYFKVTVDEDLCSQYMDGYESFGWVADGNMPTEKAGGKVTLHMKRSRSILNKTELTRLQRHYEACMNEISSLEASKHSVPMVVSLSFGLVGCAFMAGSVFAVTAEPPVIWLTALLGAPGFLFWILSYFGYKEAGKRRTAKVEPLIEKKYDEAFEVCEKAQHLLGE